jgi:Rrf2 family protein
LLLLTGSLRHALEALAYLAALPPDAGACAQDLADARGLSPAFLSQVLRRLVRAGVVTSARGRVGGYRLARPPGAVPLLDVVEAVDPHFLKPPTGLGNDFDPRFAALAAEAAAALRAVFAGRTLADYLPGDPQHAEPLHRRRGRPPKRRPPRLTEQLILAWADAWHRRTGRWPGVLSGEIPGTGGERWNRVNDALYGGHRGLPGGDSLRKLLRRNGRRG